jgi:hypothetical protein
MYAGYILSLSWPFNYILCFTKYYDDQIIEYGQAYILHMVEVRNAYKKFVGKPLEKTSFGRPRHRWEDNINMDLKETGWEGVDWIHPAYHRDC